MVTYLPLPKASALPPLTQRKTCRRKDVKSEEDVNGDNDNYDKEEEKKRG